MVILFVEGDTEVEFYNKLINYLKLKTGKGIQTEVINIRGVGKYKDRALRIFNKRIKNKYPDYVYEVMFCYDTDVFEFANKPPINWKEITTGFESCGAIVHHVRAKSCIEDWFLLDPVGICSYLRLSKKLTLKGYHGNNGLQNLFRKANKVYIKGNACKGLVQALNMSSILPEICKEVHVICEAIGLDCTLVKLCENDNERKLIKG